MIKHTLSIAALAAAAFAPAAFAQAEFSGNVALTTDYVFRGISQTNEDPGISGGFDVVNGLFYAGVWAANVDFQDEPEDTNFEIDFYAGLAGSFEGSGIGWDVGVIYYAYPDAETADLDLVEIYGGLSKDFDSGFSVGGYVYIDPDNENSYIEGSAGYAFNDMFAVDATLGNASFDGGGDYTNWSVGATTSYEGFDFDLRYHDTDIDNVSVADERIVFTVGRSF